MLVLGAMSPGPSLALILRNTVAGGKTHGIKTALGHGLGFGLFMFITGVSLVTLVDVFDSAMLFLNWGGAALLVWLGVMFSRNAFRPGSPPDPPARQERVEQWGFLQGFLVALLNPKIFAWMLGVFAPFISAAEGSATVLAIAALGMTTDGGWYVLVVLVFAAGRGAALLQSWTRQLDGLMALFMFGFAAALLIRA